MVKKPRAASADKEQEIELLKALRFVSIAQQPDGQAPYMRHCAFRDNDVVAFDGILAAGYPCQEFIDACPNTAKLTAALSKMRGAYSLTLMDNLSLAVQSDKLRVLVECLSPVNIEHVQGDPGNYVIGPEFVEAGIAASEFTRDSAQTVVASCVCTLPYSLVGTDASSAFIEAYHGHNTPAGLLIPNSFFAAVAKIELKPVRFGFSDNSFTLYFENGAWIRTQLYVENYPDIETKIMPYLNNCAPSKFDVELIKALDAVTPHVDDKARPYVYMHEHFVRSHPAGIDKGAQYRHDGLPFSVAVDAKKFKTLWTLCNHWDFTTYNDRGVFRDDRIRGLLMYVSKV